MSQEEKSAKDRLTMSKKKSDSWIKSLITDLSVKIKGKKSEPVPGPLLTIEEMMREPPSPTSLEKKMLRFTDQISKGNQQQRKK